MLSAPDAWTAFADRYLDALDEIARSEVSKSAFSRSRGSFPASDYARAQRTRDLAQWHALLTERLAGSEAEDRLGRLARHAALDRPELTSVRSR